MPSHLVYHKLCEHEQRVAMEADDFDAAVLAADERMSELWTDLRRLVEKTAPSGARDVHVRVRGDRRAGIEAGRMTASADWDELFGGSDEGDDSDSFEPQPEPRRVPSTRPASRGPRANDARTSSPHWTVDSFGVDDIDVTTRVRTSLSRVEASTSASARGRSTLRRAIEDILRADWLVRTRAGNDDEATAANGKEVPVDEFDLLLRKEKQMTRELRERMRKMMERRRMEEQSAEPEEFDVAPGIRGDSEFDDVFIDPSLLDGDVCGSRAHETHYEGKKAPWGGGGGRRRVDVSTEQRKLWPRQPVATSPWFKPGFRLPQELLASLDELSVFEERCAVTLHRHIAEMDAKTRRKALEDWGALDGKFSGAKLFLRIEVMMVSEDECETGGVGGLVLRRGSSRFVPVQPQPLRRLKLCVGGAVGGSPATHVTLGWIEVDYDKHGRCRLPPLCACVMYRRRVPGGETAAGCRHFVQFSLRDHRPVFARAIRMSERVRR